MSVLNEDPREPLLEMERLLVAFDEEARQGASASYRGRTYRLYVALKVSLDSCDTTWTNGWVAHPGVHRCSGTVGHPGRHTCIRSGCRSWRNREGQR